MSFEIGQWVQVVGEPTYFEKIGVITKQAEVNGLHFLVVTFDDDTTVPFYPSDLRRVEIVGDIGRLA